MRIRYHELVQRVEVLDKVLGEVVWVQRLYDAVNIQNEPSSILGELAIGGLIVFSDLRIGGTIKFLIA